MDVWALDWWQRDIFERAGCDPDEAVSPLRLARALLGEDGVRVVPHVALPADGQLVKLNGRDMIFLRKGLSRERARFLIAHELAELALRGIVDEQIENACNAIAAAVLAPRRAFSARMRAVGRNWEQLALPFGMTQTAAALRAGEADRMPLAVVAKIVRTRGPDEFQWPEERVLRRWATSPPAGLAKTRLTDDPKRVVLVADEAEAV